jgi:hypothetical protein
MIDPWGRRERRLALAVALGPLAIFVTADVRRAVQRVLGATV